MVVTVLRVSLPFPDRALGRARQHQTTWMKESRASLCGQEVLGPAASVSGVKPSSCRCLGLEPSWDLRWDIAVGLK